MLDNSSKNVPTKLMTIGYEGSSITDFIATLTACDVTTLIDVRELPLSRKKGFSKRALSGALEGAGIKYQHVRQLGDPKPGRDAARSGDMQSFRRIFGNHIKQESAQTALNSVVPTILEGGACLLCFERCHRDCHRAIVANELTKIANIELAHIGVKHGIAERAY